MQALTELDRTFLAREVVRKTAGEDALESLSGPLIWHHPDDAIAQVLALLSPDELLAMRVPIELIARIIRAGEYLGTQLAPSEWAEGWRIHRGLIPPTCLAAGVGEGMGLARSMGYKVYDTHCVTVYDAIQPFFARPAGREKTLGMKAAWLDAIKPYELAFAGYVMVTLMHGPWFGALRLMEMIDTKEFTQASIQRLMAAGFGEHGMEIGELIKVIRG